MYFHAWPVTPDHHAFLYLLQREMSERAPAMTTFSSLVNEIQDAPISGHTQRQLKALTRITNLFVAGAGRHSKQQIELFDEVFKTLVAVIELETRIKLSRHLATIPDAPSALVRAFAFDDSVAFPR